MTNTAATLLRRPDLPGEELAEVPVLDVVMVILSSSRSEDMTGGSPVHVRMSGHFDESQRRAGGPVPVAFRQTPRGDPGDTVSGEPGLAADESLVTRAG
jgi:hypothetical protein